MLIPIHVFSVIKDEPKEPPNDISPSRVKYPRIPFHGSKKLIIAVDAMSIMKLLKIRFRCLINRIVRFNAIMQNVTAQIK